jgi:transcriptional regulator with XRE-family HTH domain
MYRNLEAEFARQGITKTKVAQELGITLGTLSLKLNGKYKLTLPEAIKIKKILNVDLTIEYLFETKEIRANPHYKN